MKSYRHVLLSRVPEGQRRSARDLVQLHRLPSPGSLRALIQKLEGSASHAGGGGTTPIPPNRPTINSVTNQGSGNFQITGNGFLKSHAVHIRVVNVATFASDFFQATSDSAGNLDQSVPIAPQAPGTKLAFSANDERPDSTDATGTLWSKPFTITV